MESQDATKKPEASQEEATKIEKELPEEQSTMMDGPEVDISREERDNSGDETKDASEQELEETGNDIPDPEVEEQKVSHSEVENSDVEHSGMDIDTKPTNTASGKAAPADSKEEVEEAPGTAGDPSFQSGSKDVEDKETARGRPRRSSTRNKYQSRTLRPRTSGRVNNAGSASESPAVQEATPQKSRPMSGVSMPKPIPTAKSISAKQDVIGEENTPRPVMEAKGLVMRIDDAVFVTEDQLDELKIARLTDKKVKPFEKLTFQDLRTYNRDQLRAYCYAYGMARRKKTEMEADMARYLSYWNKGREGFALHEYVPTSSRVIERVEPNPGDNIGANRTVSTVQAGSASREGSTTPTAGTGKALATAKPSSNRGATPSRGAGPATNSARLSGSQGSSALSSASPAGAPTSTGNSQAPGSTQVGTQRNTATITRTAKPSTTPAPPLPRGFGTSFKQRVHARQAGAKFKAAYNGAGPAIVNIVENAAAYFEGKDSPDVILDQAKSYERYQFNVDMLNEIFDGVPDESDEADGDVEMAGTETNEDGNDSPTNAARAKVSTGIYKKNVLDDIASRVALGNRKAQTAEVQDLEKQFKELEEQTKYTERTNMRLFQRLERAETREQIESVKQEFETIHGIKFDECNPRPLVRRKLDKSLPPLVMPDEKCRILRFKVS